MCGNDGHGIRLIMFLWSSQFTNQVKTNSTWQNGTHLYWINGRIQPKSWSWSDFKHILWKK
jgi:hypothetical protein